MMRSEQFAPGEIKSSLVGAMTDDQLADQLAWLKRTRQRRVMCAINGDAEMPTRRAAMQAVGGEIARRTSK